MASYTAVRERSEGRPCEEHDRCVVIFRTRTTLRDGIVHDAREYGLRAFPLHIREEADAEIEVTSSAAGEIVTEFCRLTALEERPMLKVGEVDDSTFIYLGHRVGIVWHRVSPDRYVGTMRIAARRPTEVTGAGRNRVHVQS